MGLLNMICNAITLIGASTYVIKKLRKTRIIPMGIKKIIIEKLTKPELEHNIKKLQSLFNRDHSDSFYKLFKIANEDIGTNICISTITTLENNFFIFKKYLDYSRPIEEILEELHCRFIQPLKQPMKQLKTGRLKTNQQNWIVRLEGKFDTVKRKYLRIAGELNDIQDKLNIKKI